MSNVVKIPVSTRLQEEVPVPKSRRVLPEHEGRYKIKMPSGTTAKTQKILEQGLPAGIYTKNWTICLHCTLENGICKVCYTGTCTFSFYERFLH